MTSHMTLSVSPVRVIVKICVNLCSEYETDAEAGSTGERSKHGREEKKGPRHVHSFTFSSLSR